MSGCQTRLARVVTLSRQERHKEGRYPVVNRLSPAEVRIVIDAVEDANDARARAGLPVVDVVKLRRVIRG